MATIVTKTVKPSGGGDYSTLAAFVAGEQRNLISREEIARAEVYAGSDGAACNIAGFQTDGNCHVRVEPAPGAYHNGVIDASNAYRYESSTYLTVSCYARLDGIQVSPLGRNNGIYVTPSCSMYSITNCIINTGSYALQVRPNGAWGAREHRMIANNLIIGPFVTGISVYDYSGDVYTCILNNTMRTHQSPAYVPITVSAESGIWAEVINNACCGDFEANYVEFILGDPEGYWEVRGDNNWVGTGGQYPGAFLSPGYKPNPYGPLFDRGSSTIAYGGSAVSIDGTTRPQGANWDIGAFELYVEAKLTGGTSAGTSSSSATALALDEPEVAVITKTVRSGGNYTSLAAFMAGEQRNLVAQHQIARAEVYAGTDTARVTASGWGTNEECYVLVEPAPGVHHNGAYSATGRYTLSTSNIPLTIINTHLRVRGIRIVKTSGTQAVGMVDIQSPRYAITECVLQNVSNTNNGFAIGITTAENEADSHYNHLIAHNLFVNTSRMLIMSAAPNVNSVASFTNNTVLSGLSGTYNVRAGITSIELYVNGAGTTVCHFRDNVVIGGGDSFTGASGTTLAFNNNLFLKQADATRMFSSPSGNNYMPRNTGELYDTGDDNTLYAPPVSINGLERPQDNAWDIGAFELLGTIVSRGGSSLGSSSAAATWQLISAVGASAFGTSSAAAAHQLLFHVGASAYGTSDAHALAQLNVEAVIAGAHASGGSFASILDTAFILVRSTAAFSEGASSATLARTLLIKGIGAGADGAATAEARWMLLKTAAAIASGASLAELISTSIVMGQRMVLRGSGDTARITVYGGGRAQEVGVEGLVLPGSDGRSYFIRVDPNGAPLIEVLP